MSFYTTRPSVVARHGMVATSETQAAMAGLRVLEEGGNAVDAAIATSAALCVTEPMSTGLGGDMFALTWMAKDRKVTALNGSGRAGRNASLEETEEGRVQGDAAAGGAVGDGAWHSGRVGRAFEEAWHDAPVPTC